MRRANLLNFFRKLLNCCSSCISTSWLPRFAAVKKPTDLPCLHACTKKPPFKMRRFLFISIFTFYLAYLKYKPSPTLNIPFTIQYIHRLTGEFQRKNTKSINGSVCIKLFPLLLIKLLPS